MKPTQGGGGGRAAAIALNRLITQEESPFIKICDGGEGAAPGGLSDASRALTRNTMITELRDMFLARRHRAVLPVPYFEFAKLQGRTAKTEYVAEKLRAAGLAM